MIARRLTLLTAAVALVAAAAWVVYELAASYFHLFSIFGVKP